MTEPEELEDDLFADLYDGDDAPTKNEEPILQPDPTPMIPAPVEPSIVNNDLNHDSGPQGKDEDMYDGGQNGDTASGWNDASANVEQPAQYNNDSIVEEELPRIGIKEDGKMFIGGLNWETTDQSLKEYFSQFGEVQECTVMRDGASGRSRGFGFLTFRNPRDVNAVMVKEHYLDGKIIDPKRAIPRDEQERTSKIFVGGVSQDATETIFKEYFAQYGRVVDATLMMDKDTGRPRGFGFVTFDSESAVDNTLNGDLTILGKPIEVKKAQPRGNMREDEDVSLGRGGPGGGRSMRGGRNNFSDRDNGNHNNNQNNNQMGGGPGAGMTPQMMAQYWAKMQQYLATMQQQMAMNQMGGVNPAMMQQMQQMQQMRIMQQQQQQQAAAQQQQQSQTRGSASPMPDAVQSSGENPSTQNNQNNPQNNPQNAAMMQAIASGMNPAMMAQMGMNPVMLAQMQAQMSGGGAGSGNGSPGPPTQPGGGGGGHRGGTPSFNAQDQLLFEQQKYEQQQARAGGGYGGGGGNPTSWEGMYEDVPPPGGGGGHEGFRGRGRGGYGGYRGGRGGLRGGGGDGGGGGEGGGGGPREAPPANAPTGPKNAGKPGANWRGGGRGGHRGGFHPYQR